MTWSWGSKDAVADTGHIEMILNPFSFSYLYTLSYNTNITVCISFAYKDHHLWATILKGNLLWVFWERYFFPDKNNQGGGDLGGEEHRPYPCFYLCSVVMPDAAASLLAPWGDKLTDAKLPRWGLQTSKMILISIIG